MKKNITSKELEQLRGSGAQVEVKSKKPIPADPSVQVLNKIQSMTASTLQKIESSNASLAEKLAQSKQAEPVVNVTVPTPPKIKRIHVSNIQHGENGRISGLDIDVEHHQVH